MYIIFNKKYNYLYITETPQLHILYTVIKIQI